MADAHVGEWVRYRVTYGGEETVVVVEVVEVKDDVVRFEHAVEKKGAFVPPFPDALKRRPILESLPEMGTVLKHEVAKGKLADSEAWLLQVSME